MSSIFVISQLFALYLLIQAWIEANDIGKKGGD